MELLLDKYNLVLLITASLNFVLALLVYLNGKGERVNWAYTWNIIAIIGWIFAMFLFRSAPASTSLFWCQVLYITPTLIASSFLYFTYIFPYQEKKDVFFNKVVIFSINLLLVILIAIPGVIIKDVNIIPGQEKEIIFTNLYFIYVVYTVSFFGYAFLRLIRKFLFFRNKKDKKDQTRKVQVIYLFLGYFLATNLAFVTNLIMPWMGYFFLNWLGQVFTVFMVGFTVYGILRYNLFKIKLALSEFLVVSFAALLLINIFLFSHTLQGYVWTIFLFLVFLVLGVILIRSVLKEIEAYEEIEGYVKELRKVNSRLKQLNKQKNEFMSFAAHQLKSPLTSVKGFTSLLLNGSLGPVPVKIKDVIEKMHSATDSMADSVEDYLNISRIEQGKMSYDYSCFDLYTLAKSVAGELRSNAYNKNQKITVRSDKSSDYMVEADQGKVKQVIGNFLDNAIKYTQEGGKIFIYLNKVKNKRRVRVAIKDNGTGIEENELEDIFKRYTRTDNTKKITGSGLGLYIARQMIEDQKGSVWAESEGLGKGSTFFIELPKYKK